MLIQPCLIVVDPVIVLAPDKVKIPEPFLIKDPSPDKFPENIELLSRYHNLDGTGGFAILESTDPAALADYALDWNGLIEIVITPIMDDETIGAVLGKKFG